MITVTLPLPPSSNIAYVDNERRRGRHLSERAKAWKDEAMSILATQIPETVPRRFSLTVRLWFPDARKRDVMNYGKLPQDVLCAVWGCDDNFTIIPITMMEFVAIDRGNPRCEVVVDEI